MEEFDLFSLAHMQDNQQFLNHQYMKQQCIHYFSHQSTTTYLRKITFSNFVSDVLSPNV